MKKLLIIADGEVAARFVQRAADTYSDINLFDIVHSNDSITPSEAIHCRYYRFDPTSFTKLEAIFSRQIYTVYIVMRDKDEIVAVYKNIRLLNRDLMIYILDVAGLNLPNSDKNMRLIKSDEILANRLMAVVPNVPVTAQYVGLGIGEIIEAKVPFGSSFAYRHIGGIEQKKWQIGALYRNDQLVLPNPSIMVRPGDNLLLIGQPSILKTVYKAIKIESGQFPAPFGRNLFLLLDTSRKRAELAEAEVRSAINLHKRIKNNILFIKIINPDNLSFIANLRQTVSSDILISVAYSKYDVQKELLNDLARLNVGLMISSEAFWQRRKNRQLLFRSGRPVWKLGEKSVEDIGSGNLLLTANPMLENISSVLFDLSSQFSLQLKIYPVGVDQTAEAETLEHYENLATIHSRTISVQTGDENAVLRLKKGRNLLLFFPFEESLIKRSVFDIFNLSNIERMNAVLSRHHQLFIPVL